MIFRDADRNSVCKIVRSSLNSYRDYREIHECNVFLVVASKSFNKNFAKYNFSTFLVNYLKTV